MTLLWGPTPARNEVGDRDCRRQGLGRVRGRRAHHPAPVELSVLVATRSRRSRPTRPTTTASPPSTSASTSSPGHACSFRGLGGYGAQFNQHVYAAITPAPPGSLPDLEAKVKALEPQLVRIFFNARARGRPGQHGVVRRVGRARTGGRRDDQHHLPDRGRRRRFQPALFMGQFAAILEDLVRTRGLRTSAGSRSRTSPTRRGDARAVQRPVPGAARGAPRAWPPRPDRADGRRPRRERRGRRDHRVWFHYMAEQHERHPRRVLGAHLLELLGHPEDGVPAQGRPPVRRPRAPR